MNETGTVIGSEIGTGIVIGCAIGNAISSVVTRGPPLVFVETELLLQGRLRQVLAAAPTGPVLGLSADVEVTDINHIGVSVRPENLESRQPSLLSQHLDDHPLAQAQ